MTDDESLLASKFMATEMRAVNDKTLDGLSGQFAAAASWLVGSLLAVNSGALIACLNAAALGIEAKQVAGSLFAFGLCMAILNAFWNLRVGRRVLPALAAKSGYWAAVTFHGFRDESQEATLEANFQAALKGSGVSDFFSWASFFAFIAGLALAGSGLEVPSQVDDSIEVSSVQP